MIAVAEELSITGASKHTPTLISSTSQPVAPSFWQAAFARVLSLSFSVDGTEFNVMPEDDTFIVQKFEEVE